MEDNLLEIDLEDPKYNQIGKFFGLRGGKGVNNTVPLLTEEQKEVFIGTMLGDSTMGYSKGKPKLSLKFEQSMAHRNYVLHLFDILKDFVGTGPRIRVDGGKQKSVWFRTFRLDIFKPYWDMFYMAPEALPKNIEALEVVATVKKKKQKKAPTKKAGDQIGETLVKGVPEEIGKYLTARVVAYWFMDDGTYHIDIESGVRDFLFSTQGFSYDDNVRLKEALFINFGIESGVQADKDKWRIGVYRSSSDKLINLIKPYLHSDFFYKIK